MINSKSILFSLYHNLVCICAVFLSCCLMFYDCYLILDVLLNFMNNNNNHEAVFSFGLKCFFSLYSSNFKGYEFNLIMFYVYNLRDNI